LTRDPVQNEGPYGEEQVERLYDTMQQQITMNRKPLILVAHGEVPLENDAKKPFFDCKEDLKAESLEVFIAEQPFVENDAAYFAEGG
jgi:hypothetical protein